MRKFISLPWKAITLTLGAMLVITLTLTIFSVYQLQEEFDQRQQEKKFGAKLIYSYLQKISNDKRILWLTTLSSQHLVKKNDYLGFDRAVQDQFDLDELRIDSVWVLNEQGQQMYASSSDANGKVRQVARQVFEQQSVAELIYCEQQKSNCFHIVAMPVMTSANEMSALISRANLSDLLFTFLALNENTRLAIVNVPLDNDEQASNLKALSILTRSNDDKIVPIIQSLPEELTLAELKKSVATEFGDEHFSVSLFELQPGSRDGNYVMLIDDITQYRQANEAFQRAIVIIAAIIFILITLVVFVLTRRSSQRLLKLAADLPLLAEKRFDEFRRREFSGFRLTSDELDILHSSASDLADQLEELHFKIEQNTRELENIAMYDLLTGLPNRNMLNFQLKKNLATLSRSQDYVALLFLDLDDFKKVNDSHGHNMGDFLLEEAARRLRMSIRDTDIACRFGGDEFVIVLPQVKKWEDVERVADKLLQAFKQPIQIEDHRFYVSTSIGGALAKDNSITAEDLIRNADMAMYEAKDNGGNCYQIYDAGMYQRVAHKVLLETEVREAIVKGQFSLSLQPQVEIETGRLFGFEALLRWNHPKRGLVSPDEFIPVLENSKHMIELGYWVIRHSIELLKQLNEAGYTGINIAINLSAGQFVDPGLYDFLVKQIQAFGVDAGAVELELTERTLVEDIDKTLETMHKLRDRGFSFSIDDFGTGYSSLSYLKKMPVDCIKIDKCFVSGMLDNQADMQIVMSTIAMVRNLGMKVIAEGVENRAQLRFLKSEQCDLVQGYLFSRPISETGLLEELKTMVNRGIWVEAAQMSKQHLLESGQK
ncbi:EAL domain-containing protein [Thalassomonas viridans]|uniref:EAL domain-containing protein n=1 Tax=Thalassomonas viridans TaxID=137584 RepID=A0AAE9Z6X2_9GAMM|nr:EAL domain-containing protein [Thalassomonas viridans]WDE06383.1 EAL domain-containing protein [Thalassomonas viridans]